MNDILILIVVVGIWPAAAALLFLAYVRPFLALRKSPAADVTLIKARMDGEAHRVVDVARDGNDWTIDRGGTKSWRKYCLTIEYPDGRRIPRTVGVSTTVIFAPYLVTYGSGSRQPLWTRHQASLP